jgi:HD-GYP domain-containing protein (c-di-GMP phosphodiesterase class II)
LTDRVREWGTALREEFGAPFVFFEVASGAEIGEATGLPPRFCDPILLASLLADGKARVRWTPEGQHQLALVLYESGQPVMVSCGELAALAGPETPEGHKEQARLQKWVQSVADRLRLADQCIDRRASQEEASDQALAWEGILALDHLIRRLRIHKEPAKNQQRVIDATFRLLNVQTLLWVPQQADMPMITRGDPILSPPECRALAACLAKHPDYRPLEPLICNDVPSLSWANRFPRISNLIGFVLTDQGPLGWVIAINNRGGKRGSESDSVESAAAEGGTGLPAASACVPFRKTDATLLTSFVALLELHSRASTRYQDLKELLVGLTRSLTAALDAKDSYTYGHSERVARIAVELGRELGLQGDELSDIYLAGLLHDVGKIGIRDSVLGKAEPLTPEEFEHIKQHVTIGYAILSDLRPIRNLLPGVLYHHEHWDGKGYPDGLAGEAIPLLARILAVADAYDAMSTNRPYRDALPCRKVEEILTKGGGSQWDKRIIEAFLRCRQKIHTIRQRGVGDSLQIAIDGALRIDKSSLAHRSEIIPR